MKKCYSLLRMAYLLQDVLNRRLLFQNKPALVSTKGNHHHHFFVLIGQKKHIDAAKIVAARKMLLKRSQQTFVNGLLGFITLGIYTPLEACVCSQ